MSASKLPYKGSLLASCSGYSSNPLENLRRMMRCHPFSLRCCALVDLAQGECRSHLGASAAFALLGTGAVDSEALHQRHALSRRVSALRAGLRMVVLERLELIAAARAKKVVLPLSPAEPEYPAQ